LNALVTQARNKLIRVCVLGAAAGGGFPQWNCACSNCRDSRTGKIPQSTQSSIALSSDGEKWLLVNASPDLPRQVDAFPPLQPSGGSSRNSPISGICLTNADIDHSLGLALLRQQEKPLVVYATSQIRNQLHWIDDVLRNFCKIDWRLLPEQTGNLESRVVDLGWSIAWEFRDQSTGKTILLAPAVREISGELAEAMQRADTILFDGTFWSDDELKSFRTSARSAKEMGHLPVRESLRVLERTAAKCKIYIHINNTNPILQPDSEERKQVERCGVIVGYDGLQLEL
jgi:pyrroloquinoline quinone biosynthesis protein B